MKRIALLFVVLFSVAFAEAHNHEYSRSGESDHAVADGVLRKNGFYANLALGPMFAYGDTYFGVNVNGGYRQHLTHGVSWDIVKVGITTDFSDLSNARFMTGVRYNPPGNICGRPIYLDAAIGYHFLISDVEYGGFAYEIGAGVSLTEMLSAGFVWEGGTCDGHIGMFGLRLGVNF